jgi:regulator of protease activity HflC (stomatin/prohibitin superfamily)
MLIVFFSLLVILAFLWRGMKIVPQQEAWIVQRFGRFARQLEPGLNWVIPLIDEIAYRHSLKEEAIDVPEQTAITQDNVSVILDGIVYIKLFDPVAASYGAKNPVYALTQLVQTTMRSEIGKLSLDKTFEERESLNTKMVEAINEAAASWGVKCMRYEIKDIKMPEDIRKAMEIQKTAEQQRRARIHGAKGEAESIEAIAIATAKGISLIAEALNQTGGEKAASLQVAEKYIDAFRQLAKDTNTVILPANLQHPGSIVAEAMMIYETVKRKTAPFPLPVER